MKNGKQTTVESAAALGEFHEAAQQDQMINKTAKNAGILGLIGFSTALAVYTAAAPQDEKPMSTLPDKVVKGGLALGFLGVGGSLGAVATRRRERSQVKQMADALGIISSPVSELSHPPLAKERYTLPDGTLLLPPEDVTGEWKEVVAAQANSERIR